jgi:peroxiredoxin
MWPSEAAWSGLMEVAVSLSVREQRTLRRIADELAASAPELFYRGAWCPYCNAQLRAFQRAGATLADAGVQVVALSVDDEATTADLIAKHGLTFPVGFGADARAVADLTGAFVNSDPVYLQSTGFVLDPAGKVMVSVYSSGAIGRLVADDVAGLVRYAREHVATSALPSGEAAGGALEAIVAA